MPSRCGALTLGEAELLLETAGWVGRVWRKFGITTGCVISLPKNAFQELSGFPVFFDRFSGFWSRTLKLGSSIILDVDAWLTVAAPLSYKVRNRLWRRCVW